MFFKRNRDAILFGIALFAFTGYVLLDTFVIPRSYEAASQAEGTGTASASEYGTEDSATPEGADGKDTDSAALESAAGEDTDSAAAESGAEDSEGTGGKDSASSPDGEKRKDSDTVSQRGDGESKRPGRHKRSSSDSTEAASEAAESSSKKGTSEKTSEEASQTTEQQLDLSGGTVVDTYSSGDKTITLYEYCVENTQIYVADVVLQSAGSLQTAFAQETYGKNVTAKTSEIASHNNAVLAINGDFYGARENGYVIRNGVLYRDTSAGDQEDLVIYADGSFEVINESTVTAQELLDSGAMQVFSFGPALLQGGEVAVSAGQEVGKAMASNPRTAVGIVNDLHYVFVVSDGRTQDSEGLSLSGLAAFMHTLGVTTAYNLDGGGSSTMYFNGKVVNNPTTSGKSIKERSVSDIVYIQ